MEIDPVKAIETSLQRSLTRSGVYQISLDEYIADPAPMPSLNSGIAHTIITQSPRHAWEQHPRLNPNYESDNSYRLDIGTIAHALLLEADQTRVALIQADDWRTKAAKEARDDARMHGKIPVLLKEWEKITAMVSVACHAIQESEIADAWANGKSEQTLLWAEHGIWLRSRPDRVSGRWDVLFDYKTCSGSAAPASWGRGHLHQHGYDLQATLALRGTRHLNLASRSIFVFLVQEIEPPYAVSLVSLSPEWLEIADEQLRTAMSLWKRCLRTNHWPSYPARVAYLDMPAYVGLESAFLPELAAEDIF